MLQALFGKHNSFLRLLKKKGFKEERVTTMGWYDLGTSHDPGIQQEPGRFGLSYFLEQARLVTRCDGALAGLLARACGETQLPGLFAQFERHKQDALCCGIMLVVGRCRGHGLSPPWW